MPEVSALAAAPLILERRPFDADVCDRAGPAACLSKDDLEAFPRVAFELAFA